MNHQTSLDLEICEHRRKTRLGKEHLYCPSCGCHWYLGRYVSKSDWELWIESPLDEDNKYPWE